MSIFSDNITTEIPFRVILQTKYEEAVRQAASYCWAQSIKSHDTFEHMVRWQICDIIGPFAYNRRDYKYLNSDTGFEYIPDRNGRTNATVRTTIFFMNKRTSESIGYQLEETVLIKTSHGSI